MKSIKKSNPNPCSELEVWPSDLLLMEYLLGSLPQATRRSVDGWLAEHPRNSEKMSLVADAVLAAAEATAHWPGSLAQVQGSPASFVFPVRRLVGILSLAATLLVAFFSLRGFRADSLSQNRIAIAWAEALPGPDAELPAWILEPVVVDVVGPAVGVDLLAADVGEADDDSDTSGMFGFSSDEPPEWLLAAVFSMGSEESPTEGGEVNH